MLLKTETRFVEFQRMRRKKMKHEDVAKQIIKNVGGAENINNAWHCMTIQSKTIWA